MSKKRTPGKTPPTVNIVVKRDVSGNIIIGNENQINRHTSSLFSSGQGIVFVVFVFLLAFVGVIFARKLFTPSLLGQPDAAQPAVTPTPIPPGMWKVEVFDNINLNGSPLTIFTLPAQSNGEGGYQIRLTPAALRQQVNNLPASNYSLRLAGEFEFQEGYFEFHCEHHDGCRVYVDGVNWIDAWWDGSGAHDLARTLSAGSHMVVIEFYDKSGAGLLETRWNIKP